MPMRTALLILLAVMPLAAQELEADSWVYWLQDININKLASCPAELAVIDYSNDGTDRTAFTADEIASVANSGTLPLAYFSIGEAEDYRFYWQSSWDDNPPAFIDDENPGWPGNYKVKYWKKGWWKQALEPYLDRILAAGFKGVYLDIVDAYYYWAEEGMNERKTARRMVKLVKQIADYCRAEAGNEFLIVPQNGMSIIDDSPRRMKKIYLNTISAVGLEDLFFNIWSEDDQQYRLMLLEEFNNAGCKAFLVEYIRPRKRSELEELIRNSGLEIIGYAAHPDRDLDEIICR